MKIVRQAPRTPRLTVEDMQPSQCFSLVGADVANGVYMRLHNVRVQSMWGQKNDKEQSALINLNDGEIYFVNNDVQVEVWDNVTLIINNENY